MGVVKGSSILCSLQNRDSHLCLQSESSHIQKDPDSRASEGDRSESEGEWAEVEWAAPPPPICLRVKVKSEDPSQVKDFIDGISFAAGAQLIFWQAEDIKMVSNNILWYILVLCL